MSQPPSSRKSLLLILSVALVFAGVLALVFWLGQGAGGRVAAPTAGPAPAAPGDQLAGPPPNATPVTSTPERYVPGSVPPPPPAPNPQRTPPDFPARAPGTTAAASAGSGSTPPEEVSPLAATLAERQSAPERQIQAVMGVLRQYLGDFRAYPAGDNVQVTRALTGNNPQARAYLPPEHPAISPGGELLDGWGEPYFFHMISRDELEIRSAGPDREMYTGDDLLEKSPGAGDGTQL